MAKQKTPQEKLVGLGGTVDSAPQPASQKPDFARSLIHHSDSKEAAQLIEYHASAVFDQGEGAELERLRLHQKELNTLYNSSEIKLNSLDKTLSSTKQYVKVSAKFSDGDKPVSFLGWNCGDQIASASLCLALIVVMVIGAVNIYTNLMASGEAVFIDQSWLAWCISLLAPASSLAFKFISNFFEYETSKRRYALCVYCFSALAILGWSIAFSMSFTGAAGGFDLETALEGDGGKGALLVWLTIIAEILTAGALQLALSEISRKYSPDLYRENMAYINAEKALKKHRDHHEVLSTKRGNNFSEVVSLENKRKTYIAEELGKFFALKNRMNSLNTL